MKNILPHSEQKSNADYLLQKAMESGIQSSKELGIFMGQMTVESGHFKSMQENLHYSASAPEAILVNGLSGNNKTAAGILVHEERAKKANPLTFISKNTPPFLAMVGDKDIRVSPNQSELLHDALIEKGVDSTFYIMKEAGHGGVKWAQTEVSKLLIDFLDKKVKKSSGITVEKSSTKFVEQ